MIHNTKLPVLVLAFNRYDHVLESMKAISEYKPQKIYLECDGPRFSKPGEEDAVRKTRQAMLDAIDWPCEVNTLFREENLGCAKAVSGAISWFFENEEYGVIIEDDVVVGQDFFYLCEELLPRYADQDSVMQISAQNFYSDPQQSNTYIYTNDFHCWGWATWRRAWNKMDMSMKSWPDCSWISLVKTFDLFRGSMMYYYWSDIYNHLDTNTSWATRWYYSIISNNGLVIQPGVNLAINIGMKGGTHYDNNDSDPYSYLKIAEISRPLIFNDEIQLDKNRVVIANKDFFRIRKIGAINKVKKLFHI